MKYTFYIVLLTFFILAGCGVKKGYDALRVYNYFEAKEQFEKKIEKHPAAASFGLASIYLRNDNPFSNIDSAYNYIQTAVKAYELLTEKDKLTIATFGVEKQTIVEKRQEISEVIFNRTKVKNTIEAYNTFITQHYFSYKKDTAIYLRDKLAYQQAKEINTSAGYQYFLNTYPTSVFFAEITNDLYTSQFYEATESKTAEAYSSFLKKYPQHPFRKQAEDILYQMVTEKNTPDQIEYFIDKFPENSNINDAWMKLYRLKTESFTRESITDFTSEHEAFPFKQLIVEDLGLTELTLLPYKVGAKYGFITLDDSMFIAAAFDYVTPFKEGVAVAEQNGKYGFINKRGSYVIPPIYEDAYEFEQGRAIVMNKDRFGMIDKTGKEIIPLVFKDIGPLSCGLFYAQKDEYYGYFDQYGFQRIQDKYEEAFTFNDNQALVKIDGKFGYIDQYGSYLMSPLYTDFSSFNSDLFIVKKDSLYTVVNKNYTEIIPANYSFIGSVNEERALVIKEDKVGYLNAKGREIIAPKFEVFPNVEQLGGFINGYAKIKSKDKFGLIDSLGEIVLPTLFSDVGNYSELIAISKGNGYGYTDNSTRLKIPYMYEYAESFKHGIGVVQNAKLYGVINRNNEILIPIEYTNISALTDSLLLLNRDSKFGVATLNGEIIIPVEYQQIKKMNSNVLILSKSDTFNYFYIPKRKFITLKESE